MLAQLAWSVVLGVALPASLFAQPGTTQPKVTQPKVTKPRAPAPKPTPVALPPGTLERFSATLKQLLLSKLPDPLYAKNDNWDHQEISPRLRGLRIVHEPRNDGTWRKIKVTPHDAAHTLEVKVYDLKNKGPDHMAFKTFLALATRIEMEEQIWESGHRLLSTSFRARVRIKLDLALESKLKFDFKGGILPDIVFRLKVKDAKVSYDNMVVEHLAGVGGTAARWTGEALRSALKEWKPSIERDLFTKASAAILKAGDTREVRLGLSNLTGGK